MGGAESGVGLGTAAWPRPWPVSVPFPFAVASNICGIDLLQVLLVAVLVAFAIAFMGVRGKPLLQAIE